MTPQATPLSSRKVSGTDPNKPFSRYVTVDKDGCFIGFFRDDVHKTIPAGAIKITEDQYQQIHGERGFHAKPKMIQHRLVNGNLEVYEPVLTLEQQAQNLINEGLTITLTGSLTLTATFRTNANAQKLISAVLNVVSATGSFPEGAATHPLQDKNGNWHPLTIPQYKAVSGAITTYVALMQLISQGNPLNAKALPASTINLPV